jgi:hypothetical protein
VSLLPALLVVLLCLWLLLRDLGPELREAWEDWRDAVRIWWRLR